MTANDVKCNNCGAKIEETAAFCPHCGHEVYPAVSAEAGGDTYLMLMTANVLRLRRQWALAEAKCGEVLQRDPGSAAAYSVLGDIARDQGKRREAIEWYKMALDGNPRSSADRQKLEAMLDEVFTTRREGWLKRGVGALTRGLSAAAADVRSARAAGPLALLVGTVLLVIFLIALSTILLGRRAGPPPSGGETQRASGTFVAPEAEAAGQSEAPALPASAPAVDALLNREHELVERLRAQALQTDPNCQLQQAEIDPRNGSASIIISMPRYWSAESMRESILRSSAALAQSAVSWDERIQMVEVRCHLRGEGRPEQLAAIAEGTRDKLEKLDQAAPAELEAAFRSIWWAPELRKETGGASRPEG